MEFRTLGSLEVLVGGRQVPLGGMRQRELLAILLLHRGEAVSVDRIVDSLWESEPPETATKTVQVYVSRLRKVLGEGVLVSRGGGYALEVGADQVDAGRFERLAGEGREALDRGDPQVASERLSAALDLWRGPALADFVYRSFVQSEIDRLDELRLAAREDRIDAELALGRHAALVPEIETLIAELPTRERLRGQLMLALYRSGRQSEALESYRSACLMLDRELGLKPGPELQRLEHAILTQDPELDAPSRGGPFADQRRRGGIVVAFGGGLLLAAVVAAIVASGGDADSPQVDANSLVIIDPGSGELVATVPTGVQPADIAASDSSIWVANTQDDSVTQIDAETQEVTSTTAAETSVGGMAAGAGAVWIADSRGAELVRLDPAFRSTRSIRLARGPADVLEPSRSSPLAVGNDAVWLISRGIVRVDPKTEEVTAQVPVGNGPSAVATGAGSAWVTDDTDNTVTRIDPAGGGGVTATIPVGQAPAAVAVGEGGVWVANTQDDTVSRVDPSTMAVVATIAVGGRPTGIAAGADAVWVANSLDGSISRIDPETNQVAGTIELGEAPQDVLVADDRVWVSVQASAAPPDAPMSEEEGDTAVILTPIDPGSTDPALNADLDDYQRLGATCALLYNYPDRPFPAGARLMPEVADGPPAISDGGRTYTFTLRDDFRFSPPSDEPVTAAAFERAIERGLDPTTGSYASSLVEDVVGAGRYVAGRASHVAGVTARGATLTVELERPASNLVERLSTPWFCAVPPDTPVDRDGVDLIPSAGPYYVDSYAPSQSLVLRRNPNYEGDRPQGLEEIRYEIGVTPERGIERVEAGEADLVMLDPLIETTAATPPETFRRLTEAYGPDSEAAQAGRQQLYTQPVPFLYSFIFNLDRGPFTDLRLRQAVNHAIDRRALAATPGLGLPALPTDQLIPPGMPGFEDAAIYPLTGPDLATARRLAGDEDRRALLYTCDFPECSRHAEVMREDLAAIGIELDVRQFPLGEFFSRIKRPGEPWDLAYWNWIFDYADPATFINDQFGANAAPPTRIDDPAAQEQMAAAARLTGEQRLRAYAGLDRALVEQVVPSAPFASATSTSLLSARIGCPVLHPIYGLDLAALCVRDDAEE